ncbi:MAG: YciI family protein, partial [Cyclobacteriaceae bacterium]
LQSDNEIISDGPFVEPKEIIGGIVIIRAENMEAALKLVETCPMHYTLDIEVRESKHVYSR